MTQLTNKQAVTSAEAQQLIEQLVRFALHNGMIEPLDEPFSRNALLDLFGFREPYDGQITGDLPESPVQLLEGLLDYGFAIGLIPDNTLTYRDLLDAKIMGMLMARPAETASAFYRLADTQGIDKATDRFYKLNIDSNYIRMDRISKNQYWRQQTEYGELEITVNLSKPEKDPKEIALLKTLPPSRYPKCLLCVDNVGYAGRADHPARQNLRVIPLTLQDEQWFFQYSPYVYYNEHSIVFKGEHVPMQISGTTFARLLDFVDAFPHYFIGSNADLPIVGGSILNHDHFQAGRHVFPMEVAPAFAVYKDEQAPGLSFGLVNWPLSVIRVQGADKKSVLAAGERILAAWRSYSDQEAEIAAATEQPDGSLVPHNTITPIARKKQDGQYELDLVLRNNRTSEEHPDGIFHPHSHLHHIKKENIGLIEVMGLAVLPGRLKSEMEQIAAYLTGEQAYQPSELANPAHPLYQHAAWINAMTTKYGTKVAADEAVQLIKSEVGEKFAEVLADAGVFKQTNAGRAAFGRFVNSLGYVLK